jgi:hypothetical protein
MTSPFTRCLPLSLSFLQEIMVSSQVMAWYATLSRSWRTATWSLGDPFLGGFDAPHYALHCCFARSPAQPGCTDCERIIFLG